MSAAVSRCLAASCQFALAAGPGRRDHAIKISAIKIHPCDRLLTRSGAVPPHLHAGARTAAMAADDVDDACTLRVSTPGTRWMRGDGGGRSGLCSKLGLARSSSPCIFRGSALMARWVLSTKGNPCGRPASLFNGESRHGSALSVPPPLWRIARRWRGLQWRREKVVQFKYCSTLSKGIMNVI